MPNPGQELASIDFESMLGGPLIAVVRAQAQSAIATVNFIKEVGFKKPATKSDNPDDGSETMEPIYVKFKYWKETAPYQPAVAAVAAVPAVAADPTTSPPTAAKAAVPAVPAVAAVPAQYALQYIEVPILTMLPIPYLRMEETTVDFNAKINSVEYQKTDSQFNISGELQAKAGWLWGSASLKVSTSYQRTTSQGSTVDRTYSMIVHIKAVQDEMPAGMEKVLSMLESAISSAPVTPAVTR